MQQKLSKARASVNPAIVCIPRVYRYFSRGSIGYLAMELLEGSNLDSLDNSNPHYMSKIEEIAGVLRHLGSFSRNILGPSDNGIVQGLLFEPDDGRDAFSSSGGTRDYSEQILEST